MLGKASEIKIAVEYSETWVTEWLSKHPNVIIIDIRLSLVSQSSMHQTEQAFLIIYKEDNPNDPR